jgi:hypothetical protein
LRSPKTKLRLLESTNHKEEEIKAEMQGFKENYNALYQKKSPEAAVYPYKPKPEYISIKNPRPILKSAMAPSNLKDIKLDPSKNENLQN